MKLYTLPPSPNSIKVVALAEHLGLPLEQVPMEVSSEQHKKPEYLAKNPNALMPCLEDGDTYVWESNAILVYLAMKAANQTVYPLDAKSQTEIWRWMSWGMCHWNPTMRYFLYENVVKKMFRNESADPQELQKGVDAFHPLARVLDEHLAKHPYLAGETMTIADFSVCATLQYAQMAGIPWESYKHVQDWFGRMSAMPAWKKAVPQMAAR